MSYKEMCDRRGVKVPTAKIDYRGRRVYRVEVTPYAICSVAHELVNGGCKPMAKICHYNDCTVELVEQTRYEMWVFRVYSSNRVQAENILDDLLLIIEPHRAYQEVFDL